MIETYDLVTEATAQAALALDGMELADYDPTILGFISDGVEWRCFEDSMDEATAVAWLARARGYGELAGLYVWPGA